MASCSGASQNAQRGNALDTRISGQPNPTIGTRIFHLSSLSEPPGLAPAKGRCQSIGVLDKAHEQSQIAAVDGRSADVDRPRLQQDRPEQIWARQIALNFAEVDGHPFRSGQGLASAGHRDRVGWRDRHASVVCSLAQVIGREHVDLNVVPSERVSFAERVRFDEREAASGKDLRESSHWIWPLPCVGERIGIDRHVRDRPSMLEGVQLDHPRADQRPIPLLSRKVQKDAPHRLFARGRRWYADHVLSRERT